MWFLVYLIGIPTIFYLMVKGLKPKRKTDAYYVREAIKEFKRKNG